MFSIRPSQRRVKPSVSTRMKPARAIIPMRCDSSTACIAASKPSRSPLWARLSTTATGMPAASARASPAAPARLDRTSAIRAG